MIARKLCGFPASISAPRRPFSRDTDRSPRRPTLAACPASSIPTAASYSNWRFARAGRHRVQRSPFRGPIEVNSPHATLSAPRIAGIGVACIPDFIARSRRSTAASWSPCSTNTSRTTAASMPIYPHRRYLPAKVRTLRRFPAQLVQEERRAATVSRPASIDGRQFGPNFDPISWQDLRATGQSGIDEDMQRRPDRSRMSRLPPAPHSPIRISSSKRGSKSLPATTADVAELRNVWRFDEVFSSSVVMDFDKNTNLKLDPTSCTEVGKTVLNSLAGIQLLHEAHDQRQKHQGPEARRSSHVDYKDGQLLMFFAVKPAEPMPLKGKLTFGVYDPTLYTAIDFPTDSELAISRRRLQGLRTSGGAARCRRGDLPKPSER